MSAPRNAPCPCGSGRRYKDCHGALAPGSGEASASRSGDAGSAEADFVAGNELRRRGELAAAIERYELALKRTPAHPGVLNNLGLALEAHGQRQRAEACYRDALAADPRHVEATANLARLLADDERFGESADAYDRLVALRLDLPASVYVARGIAHQRAVDLRRAEASFREAVRIAPDDAAVHLNLGTACFEQRRYADAEPSWTRALELDPGSLYALSMLAHGRQHRCDWRDLDSLFAEINRRLESAPAQARSGSRPNPFPLLSMPTTPRAQLHAAKLWAEGFAPARLAARPAAAFAPGERLRIGFVMDSFREHPMMHLSLEFWEKVDRSRLEMFAYSLHADDGNPYFRRAEAAFEHFADVSRESPARIAQRIRADRIGIVFDSNGYTENSRERIFALRPAPVQINCIGFPGTLGAPWYDYVFTDRFSLPERLAPFYAERPLYMPHMAFPSDTARLPAGPPPSRAACGLPETGFVFCCFNSAYKILPDAFASWMRLLAATPGSVLWLLETSVEAKENLRREAGRAGIDPQRLVFAAKAPVGEHVARHAAADLFLDTYPYGAHTTANDALLAGLPVVTRAGDTLVSRIAGSQLQAIGLPELVTDSPAAYEALAGTLAVQPAALEVLRDRLAAHRRTHPLFDMDRYACDFAEAMEGLWRDRGSLPD